MLIGLSMSLLLICWCQQLCYRSLVLESQSWAYAKLRCDLHDMFLCVLANASLCQCLLYNTGFSWLLALDAEEQQSTIIPVVDEIIYITVRHLSAASLIALISWQTINQRDNPLWHMWALISIHSSLWHAWWWSIEVALCLDCLQGNFIVRFDTISDCCYVSSQYFNCTSDSHYCHNTVADPDTRRQKL